MNNVKTCFHNQIMKQAPKILNLEKLSSFLIKIAR